MKNYLSMFELLLTIMAWLLLLLPLVDGRATIAPPRTMPPGARPVVVTVAFQPLKVLEVDADSATVTLQGYFDQFWHDSRLARENATEPRNGTTDVFDRINRETKQR